MSDAATSSNLIYVNDILMRSRTFEEHLTEIWHIFNQLAKLALTTSKWCNTKVEYMGLTVAADYIEPQSGRIQAIRDIAAPTNVSELRRFPGVCNYF